MKTMNTLDQKLKELREGKCSYVLARETGTGRDNRVRIVTREGTFTFDPESDEGFVTSDADAVMGCLMVWGVELAAVAQKADASATKTQGEIERFAREIGNGFDRLEKMVKRRPLKTELQKLNDCQKSMRAKLVELEKKLAALSQNQ